MQREENKAQRFLRRCMCAVCALMFAFFILVFLLSAQGPAWCRLAWTAAFVCLLASAPVSKTFDAVANVWYRLRKK